MLITITRLLITFLLSFAFGYERQRSHKTVGIGTFIFVALGACIVGIIAESIWELNPIGLLASVVTGIGFLGAGALIKGSDKVFGFTTASAVWLFSIFGLTVGIGKYEIALATYVLVWIVILVDKHFEQHGIGSYQRRLIITSNKMIEEKEINRHLVMGTKKYKLLGVELRKQVNEFQMTYLVEGTQESLNKLVKSLYKEEWLKEAKVE
ncbi:MAG TPA: MgtC/SapB family protein [Candidatus Nanoarchaeia archaeon]|nr:MgtC/SapB family protein [Candidatus Nanoarchaeia archaeon]